MDQTAIAVSQRKFRASVSVGQQRMAALHGGRSDRLEVYPTSGPDSACCAATPAPPWSG